MVANKALRTEDVEALRREDKSNLPKLQRFFLPFWKATSLAFIVIIMPHQKKSKNKVNILEYLFKF